MLLQINHLYTVNTTFSGILCLINELHVALKREHGNSKRHSSHESFLESKYKNLSCKI